MEPQPQMQMKVDQVPSSSKDNGQEHVQMEEISRRKEADPDPDKKDDGKEVKTSPSTHKNDEKDLKDDGREGSHTFISRCKCSRQAYR